MEIEKFSKLLERALSGQEPLLNDWDVFRSANYFTKENINHAIDKINQIIAQENHPQLKNALFLKAYMYQWGQDRAVNFPEAIKLYEQAILLKQPSAMAHRADMHRLGLGGHVAMTEAIKLYEQAFDLGNHAPMILQAQRFIGLINSKGGDY
ncbi:MAG: hypothetical protein PSV35_08500, partial [bacterium]|nr:hypothetical protein [bacterium]